MKGKRNKVSENYFFKACESYEGLRNREALQLINQSLCYAEDDLHEARCVELRSKILSEIDHLNSDEFFKFTQPTHELNPAIIHCVELRYDKKFGRHLVATKPIKTGEIVVMEEAFLKSLDKNFTFGRCTNCFKSNQLDLIPCNSCHSAMFCSIACKNEVSISSRLIYNFKSLMIQIPAKAFATFHKFECDIIDEMDNDENFYLMVQRSFFEVIWICDSNFRKLNRLLDTGSSTVTSIFDVDLHNYTREQLLQVFLSLESSEPTDEEESFARSFVSHHKALKTLWKNQQEREICVNLTLKIMCIMNRNAFTMHWFSNSPENSDEQGCGIFLTVSLINHSCSPNLMRVRRDGKLILVAREPILENEQLFICYQ